MNKCFLLNLEKNPRRSVMSFSKKTQITHTLISISDVTEPKARRLGYSNNQLKSCYQVKVQFQAFGNHGYRKPELTFTMVCGSLKLTFNLLTV